jgi:hypothetical protein
MLRLLCVIEICCSMKLGISRWPILDSVKRLDASEALKQYAMTGETGSCKLLLLLISVALCL